MLVVMGEQQHFCGGRLIEYFRPTILRWLESQTVGRFQNSPEPPEEETPPFSTWLKKILSSLGF